MADVIVIGAGPAGVFAARRAADLGAKTTLITRDEFGGTAANDGPVPVRTLAHAARLIREARQLGRYGIAVSEPVLDYPRLLARVREVVDDVRAHSLRREYLDRLGVTIHEKAGTARFVDPHTIETESGLRLQADKFILCAGGTSRRLPVPGFELTATHSDAWGLTAVPPSMLVVGAGATGVQVASIFNAFGSRVQLFQAGPRILATEDEDVSAAVAAAFRASGIVVRESFGTIESFETTPSGVRMVFSKDGSAGQRGGGDRRRRGRAGLPTPPGWIWPPPASRPMQRGYVRVDPYLRTSAPHVFAAGDITGRLMLVPQAIHDGLRGGHQRRARRDDHARGPGQSDRQLHRPGIRAGRPDRGESPRLARRGRTPVRFDETTRTIIDGRTAGFCKLIVDRATCTILGCHVVGERAVEIVQVVAIAMVGGDAGGRPGPGSAFVSDLCRHSRARGIPCRQAARPGGRRPGVPGWRTRRRGTPRSCLTFNPHTMKHK